MNEQYWREQGRSQFCNSTDILKIDQSMQYVSSIKFVAVYLCNRFINFSFNTPLFNINTVLTGNKTGYTRI